MFRLKAKLRQHLLSERKHLNQQQRELANRRLAKRILRSRSIRGKARIALYSPMQGEIDLLAGLTSLIKVQRGYLPVAGRRSLLFCRYSPTQSLLRNAQGYKQPVPPWVGLRPLASIDVVIVPLVAFDAYGHRLGLGGGHYDITLRKHRKHYRTGKQRPLLIGVGYHWQGKNRLPQKFWDIPLDEIVTDRYSYRCNKNLP